MVDEEKVAFMKLAGDDGEIDAYELQDILNEEFKKRQIFISSSLAMQFIIFNRGAPIMLWLIIGRPIIGAK